MSALSIDALVAESAALTKALTGLTCGGSEFFIRKGDRFVADIDACVAWVRRRDASAHERWLEAAKKAKAAETAIRRLNAALVFCAIRVGTPGEIVNASQRGQALADVRKACDEALDFVAPALSPLEASVSTPSQMGGIRVGAPVYVASRASVPERGIMWRALRDSGVNITSSWIDEDGPGQTADNGELWARIQEEIGRSHALIVYVEPDDFPLKGALVEVGMAMARNTPVGVVAPGVELEAHSMRPLGSWAAHPRVWFFETVADALVAFRSDPTPPPQQMSTKGREE